MQALEEGDGVGMRECVVMCGSVYVVCMCACVHVCGCA